MSNSPYILTPKEIDRFIETVINRLRKTELVNETSTNPEEDRLTQKEAAELLGVSVQCLITWKKKKLIPFCLLYTSPSPRDKRQSRMPSSA